MKFIGILGLIVAAFGFAACSSDSGSTSSSNAMTESVSTVSTKLKAVADVLANSASDELDSQWDITPFAAMSGVWETANGPRDLNDGTATTMKQWFIDEFNEDFKNSNNAGTTFAGRIKNSLDIFCFMAQAGVPIDNNLPSVGSHSLTLTSAMADTCGGDISQDSMDITMTVTETSDTTYYDRKMSIKLPGWDSCPFIFYARINSSSLNLAQSEDQNCDGRNQASKSIFHLDKTTSKARFYYISKNFDNGNQGFEVYQGFLSENDDQAYVVGYYGSDNVGSTGLSDGVAFTVAGKPSGGGSTAAVSANVIGSAGNSVSAGTYDGCINSSTLAVVSDSLSCDVTGSDASAAFTNVVQDLHDDYSAIGDLYNIGETTAPKFTDETDVFL
ncbi:MAG: hypothetical protein KDD33_11000 [Bdellovibrionales bacterium]|nr:hypothetical protein [Bdellovibrionales bacterium]